jgi:CheY-like chemotaxis protein
MLTFGYPCRPTNIVGGDEPNRSRPTGADLGRWERTRWSSGHGSILHSPRAALHWTHSDGGIESNTDNDALNARSPKTLAHCFGLPGQRAELVAGAPIAFFRKRHHSLLASILIVDDEPDILDALAELVSMRFPDAIVRTARNAAVALAAVAAESPALIVSDLRMPGMNGLEFLENVRDEHPGIPAFLLTAFDERGAAVDAARHHSSLLFEAAEY